jgi:hypothetical protein
VNLPTPESTTAGALECERLARRWFSVIQSGSLEALSELAHDEIVVVSKIRPGVVVHGRESLEAFVAEALSGSLHEVVTDVFRPLDESCVVVEGRMRWIDEERVIRDDPVTWALEFRDGLLLRFLPARSAIEAETLLRVGAD